MNTEELKKKYCYLYETHLHTSEASACARNSGAEMAEKCKEYGYSGIFVTDHAWGGNTCVNRSLSWKDWVYEFAKGYENAKEWGDKNGLSVWFGLESAFNGTEFLIYGITPQWMTAHPELHDAGIPEQLEIIHSGGGMVVQAHPYREEFYIPRVRLFPEYADAIEGINATHTNPLSKSHKSEEWNRQAMELAKKNHKPITAGSDVHTTTIFGGGVLSARKLDSPKDFIDLILGEEMYLLTDGVEVYDREGRRCGDENI